jgi:hypothetical protein
VTSIPNADSLLLCLTGTSRTTASPCRLLLRVDPSQLLNRLFRLLPPFLRGLSSLTTLIVWICWARNSWVP